MFLTQNMKVGSQLSQFYPNNVAFSLILYSGTKPTLSEYNSDENSLLNAQGELPQSTFNSWIESKGCKALGVLNVTPFRKAESLSFGNLAKRRFNLSENTKEFQYLADGDATWFAIHMLKDATVIDGASNSNRVEILYLGTVGLSSGDRTQDLLIKDIAVNQNYSAVLNDFSMVEV